MTITAAEPSMRILPIESISHMDRGWTRGHVTASFEELRGQPGYLELPPLMLCGVQDIDPGAGYPMHHHAGVETITILLAGSLEHEDDLGGRDVTGPDDVEVLSAGTGISHAEMAAPGERLRAMIIWVRSPAPDARPRWEKRTFPRTERRNRLVTIASGRTDAPSGAIPIHADVAVCTGVIEEGCTVEHALAADRRGYVVSTVGPIEIDGHVTRPGDRALLTGPSTTRIRALAATEILLIDL